MLNDTDAIATWEHREEDPGSLRYPIKAPTRCTDCDWTGKGWMAAVAHAQATNHHIRYTDWRDVAKQPMTVICAWCPDGRAKTAAARARGEIVTHGMCKACAAQFMADR